MTTLNDIYWSLKDNNFLEDLYYSNKNEFKHLTPDKVQDKFFNDHIHQTFYAKIKSFDSKKCTFSPTTSRNLFGVSINAKIEKCYIECTKKSNAHIKARVAAISITLATITAVAFAILALLSTPFFVPVIFFSAVALSSATIAAVSGWQLSDIKKKEKAAKQEKQKAIDDLSNALLPYLLQVKVVHHIGSILLMGSTTRPVHLNLKSAGDQFRDRVYYFSNQLLAEIRNHLAKGEDPEKAYNSVMNQFNHDFEKARASGTPSGSYSYGYSYYYYYSTGTRSSNSGPSSSSSFPDIPKTAEKAGPTISADKDVGDFLKKKLNVSYENGKLDCRDFIKNPYELKDISNLANDEKAKEINRHFNFKFAMKFHPDKNKDENQALIEKVFKFVNIDMRKRVYQHYEIPEPEWPNEFKETSS